MYTIHISIKAGYKGEKMSGLISTGGTQSGIVIEGWKTLTPFLVNSWVAQTNDHTLMPRYMRIRNTVYMQGVLKSGTSSHIMNLPVEIRPIGGSSILVQLARDGSSTVGQNVHQACYLSHNGAMNFYDHKNSWQSISCVYNIEY